MQGSIELWFATSNEHKFEEARLALREFPIVLKRLAAKGTELQSDNVSAIARHAAIETFRKAKKSLFVEDTGLFVTSLKGFPGPYASYVDRTIGPSSLLSLMKGIEKREAEFVSAVALCLQSSQVTVFRGSLKGEISKAIRGVNGFGFDPVFIPDGSRRTLAEMSIEEKGAISHRSLALRALGSWLENHRSR